MEFKYFTVYKMQPLTEPLPQQQTRGKSILESL